MSSNKIVSSIVWNIFHRGGIQGIQFILSIILARLLTPDDYGILAIIMIFISIATIFTTMGFSTALIQKLDPDELDFSSVFYFSLFVMFILYLILFFAAPSISHFYRKTILVSVIRVLSLTLLISALSSVQYAVISKKMLFKLNFLCSIVCFTISGIIGIVLAYNGFGVWALVYQQLINALLSCIILLFILPWKPRLLFSFSRIQEVFSFASKLLYSAVIDSVYKNIYGLIIGKKYSSETLGVFNRGQSFPQIIAINLDSSIQTVMLPAMSLHQNNLDELKRCTRRSMKVSSFLILPCMFGMAAIARPMIILLLTDKWLACVPFLQLACFVNALYPIHSANIIALNALGRSDIVLKLEFYKKISATIIIIITVPFGIYAIAIGQVLTGLISSFVNAFPNKKLLNYSYLEQLVDLTPNIITSVLMSFVVYSINFLKLSSLITILTQLSIGIFLYIMISKLSKNENYLYIKTVIGYYLGKR